MLRLFLLVPALALAAPAPVFNGKDLTGWVHEGPRATFTVAEGQLHCSGLGNYPNWLRTAAEYENFRLEFEYRLAQWGEAAVVLRAPRWGRPAQSGLAIVLAHDYHSVVDDYVTGAVAGVVPPRQALPPSYDAWHRARITLDGDRLQVSIDEIGVQYLNLAQHPELLLRLRRGFLGFQDLGYQFRIRNLKLEDLGVRERIVELFDGRTLEGWQLRNAGNWTVRDGSIYAFNGHGILYAPGVFGDFELTLQVRSRNRANGGVFLRGQPEGPNRGFEVQIYSPLDGVYPTGSIYGLRRSRITAEYEDRWFFMQIRLEGQRCTVRLDGATVAQTESLPGQFFAPGRIGLQIHSDDAGIEFRNVRVRLLTADPERP